MRVRIADRVAHAIIKDGTESVLWGDGILNDAGGDYVKGKMAHHPLDRITAVCNALERATDLFEKKLVHAHDSNCNPRAVRGFWLIGTPRPLPSPPPNPQPST